MANSRAAVGKSARGSIQEKTQLMSATEIDRTLMRLAHEIVERHNGVGGLVMVGIRRRGLPLAERLAKKIEEIEKVSLPVCALDITFHRDDISRLGQAPLVRPSPLPFSVEGKTVVLVDDVLYTGRTARAALDALVAHGRPRRVELCVLIDRGHRELPIQANYVGRVVQTAEQEHVNVALRVVDDLDRVMLCEKGSDR
jgi:pyrimidine operon attenuation protein/uracil phosphoribosyltransferase